MKRKTRRVRQARPGKIEINGTTMYALSHLSEVLDVTVVTLRRYVAEGKLKAQRLGAAWYVSSNNLQDFLDSKM